MTFLMLKLINDIVNTNFWVVCGSSILMAWFVRWGAWFLDGLVRRFHVGVSLFSFKICFHLCFFISFMSIVCLLRSFTILSGYFLDLYCVIQILGNAFIGANSYLFVSYWQRMVWGFVFFFFDLADAFELKLWC